MSDANDTIPAEPPTEPNHEVPRLDPLERAIVALDCMSGRVSALEAIVEDLVAKVAQPPWLDELFAKVAKIEPAASTVAEVVVLREKLAEFEARCDARHDPEPLRLRIPSNGHGG